MKNKIKIAPLNKRLFAYMIDWYFGWIFCAAPVGFMWNVMTHQEKLNFDLQLFDKPYGLFVGLIGICFGIIYYYVIPLASEGQTLGKKFLSLRIVNEDGTKIKAKELAIRQIIFVMILESSFMITGNYFSQILSIYTNNLVGEIISYAMFATFLVTCYLVFKKGKAIHDLFGHSIVVEK